MGEPGRRRGRRTTHASSSCRHRNGTEPHHAPKPGELSVGPDEQGVTTYMFDEPGVVEMACHLPGHSDFGMHGTIDVVEGAQ